MRIKGRYVQPVGFVKLTSYKTETIWYLDAACKLADHRKCPVIQQGLSQSLRCECRCHGGRR